MLFRSRAILSDRYRRIDNYEVAQTVLPIISEMQGARIESCELTDLSIASTGEVLVYGDIVRYGRPLFNSVEDERFPVPVIMPLCLTGDDISEVTFENFGKEVRLYLWERNAA